MTGKKLTEQKYNDFVDSVTSDFSKDELAFLDKMSDLSYDIQFKEFPRLLTGAIGLVDEAGEVLGLLKKVMFQGKPFDEDLRRKLKREVGDVRFYLACLYMALDMTDEEARENNHDKLSARFDNGMFETEKSENRKAGDT